MLKFILLQQPLYPVSNLETQIQCVLYQYELGGAHAERHTQISYTSEAPGVLILTLYKWQIRNVSHVSFFLLTFYSMTEGGTASSGSLLASLVSPDKLCLILILPFSGSRRSITTFRTCKHRMCEDCC